MRYLIDTNVWIDHLNAPDDRVTSALAEGRVCTHPIIIGELAVGNLAKRVVVLGLLQALPLILQASDEEVMALIEKRKWNGRGIRWGDAHLLASALINEDVVLWSNEKRLVALLNPT